MANTERRARAALGTLLLLVSGCAGEPAAPEARREAPIPASVVATACERLAPKLRERTLRGWSPGVALEGGLPLVRLGTFEDRARAGVDGEAFLAALGEALADAEALALAEDDDERARASLALSAKLLPAGEDPEGRGELRLSAWIVDLGRARLGTALAVAVIVPPPGRDGQQLR